MSDNEENEEEDNAHHDLSFKIIVIGDQFVGKSCLTIRAAKGEFETEYSPTIGFEFLTYNAKVNDKIIKLQIWDTCGQEAYRSLITNFYRNASLAMMVYAIDNKESFLHINQWLKEIKVQSHPDVKIILIGNKQDLEDKRAVSKEDAQTYADENQFAYFEETSAKSGYNAKEIFNKAAEILYEEHNKYKFRSKNEEKEEETSDKKKHLEKRDVNRKKEGGCC